MGQFSVSIESLDWTIDETWEFDFLRINIRSCCVAAVLRIRLHLPFNETTYMRNQMPSSESVFPHACPVSTPATKHHRYQHVISLVLYHKRENLLPW